MHACGTLDIRIGERGKVSTVIRVFGGGVRFPHKIVSVDSCHFPYRYDVIFPTQMQGVFYSPTPIMAVPLNIRWQFPYTFYAGVHPPSHKQVATPIKSIIYSSSTVYSNIIITFIHGSSLREQGKE